MATGSVPKQVVYPESDGEPMAETELHRKLLTTTVDRLAHRYAGDPSVHVSGNLFVYYERDQPFRVLAPDCFVAFGVSNGGEDRRVYKVWEENDQFPAVVIEFTSPSTQREDMRQKFQTYQNIWRVAEYFLFDPYEEYLKPSLLGYRMSRGELRQIKPVGGRLTSKRLGITLEREGDWMTMRDAATGRLVLTRQEAETERERERREALEAEVARLRAELAALRKKKP